MLLKILLVAVTINTLISLSGPIFNAVGKPKIQFYINSANIVVLIIFLLLLAPRYGIIGIAAAVLINSVIIFLTSFYGLMKILDIKIINAAKPLLIPAISSLLMLGIGKLIFAEFKNINDISFIILTACLGIFYLAFITLFGKWLKTGPYATLKLVSFEIFKRPKNIFVP